MVGMSREAIKMGRPRKLCTSRNIENMLTTPGQFFAGSGSPFPNTGYPYFPHDENYKIPTIQSYTTNAQFIDTSSRSTCNQSQIFNMGIGPNPKYSQPQCMEHYPISHGHLPGHPASVVYGGMAEAVALQNQPSLIHKDIMMRENRELLSSIPTTADPPCRSNASPPGGESMTMDKTLQHHVSAEKGFTPDTRLNSDSRIPFNMPAASSFHGTDPCRTVKNFSNQKSDHSCGLTPHFQSFSQHEQYRIRHINGARNMASLSKSHQNTGHTLKSQPFVMPPLVQMVPTTGVLPYPSSENAKDCNLIGSLKYLRNQRLESSHHFSSRNTKDTAESSGLANYHQQRPGSKREHKSSANGIDGPRSKLARHEPLVLDLSVNKASGVNINDKCRSVQSRNGNEDVSQYNSPVTTTAECHIVSQANRLGGSELHNQGNFTFCSQRPVSDLQVLAASESKVTMPNFVYISNGCGASSVLSSLAQTDRKDSIPEQALCHAHTSTVSSRASYSQVPVMPKLSIVSALIQNSAPISESFSPFTTTATSRPLVTSARESCKSSPVRYEFDEKCCPVDRKKQTRHSSSSQPPLPFSTASPAAVLLQPSATSRLSFSTDSNITSSTLSSSLLSVPAPLNSRECSESSISYSLSVPPPSIKTERTIYSVPATRQNPDGEFGSRNSDPSQTTEYENIFDPFTNEQILLYINEMFQTMDCYMDAVKEQLNDTASKELGILDNLFSKVYSYSPLKVSHFWGNLYSDQRPSRVGTRETLRTSSRSRWLADITRSYVEKVHSCDEDLNPPTVNTNGREMWPPPGEDRDHWKHFQERVARQTYAEAQFVLKLPDMDKFDPKDRVKLGNNTRLFGNMILMASKEWFDPVRKKFKFFWNWKLPAEHPLSPFRNNIIKLGSSIFNLHMDECEVAILSTMNILSTENPAFKDPSLITEHTEMMMEILCDYLNSNNIDPDYRVPELLLVMPKVRLMSMWYSNLIKNMRADLMSMDKTLQDLAQIAVKGVTGGSNNGCNNHLSDNLTPDT